MDVSICINTIMTSLYLTRKTKNLFRSIDFNAMDDRLNIDTSAYTSSNGG